MVIKNMEYRVMLVRYELLLFREIHFKWHTIHEFS